MKVELVVDFTLNVGIIYRKTKIIKSSGNLGHLSGNELKLFLKNEQSQIYLQPVELPPAGHWNKSRLKVEVFTGSHRVCDLIRL